MVDDDNIMTVKNGKEATGSEISVIEQRQIDHASEVVVNEFMLEQEMISIAKHYNVSNET